MTQVIKSDIRFLRGQRLSPSVQTQLAAMNSISGVLGWTICIKSGEAVFSSLSAQLDQRMLDAVGNNVFRAGTHAIDGAPAIEMEFDFTQGAMLAHDVGNGWLVVHCGPNADMSLARVTLSVTTAALRAERTLQGDLSSGRVTR